MRRDRKVRLQAMRLEARDVPAVAWSFNQGTGHLLVQIHDRAARSGEINGSGVDLFVQPNGNVNPVMINNQPLKKSNGSPLVAADLKSVTVNGSDSANNIQLVLLRRTPRLNLDDKITVNAGGGNDTIRGSGFSDRLNGGKGHDTIRGLEGNDWLYGDDGNDTLYGDGGDDHLNGGAGNDTIHGGDGIDIISLLSGAQDKKYSIEGYAKF